jgi:aconitase A
MTTRKTDAIAALGEAAHGCTTCMGNSGPLIPEVSAAVTENVG